MQSKRYTTVAVVLHWTIAILILSQIAGGLYMHNLPNTAPGKFDLYQLHKSFGLSILLLSIVRLGWRLTHRPPALPDTMPGWQVLIARATHWLFYFFMIVTPLVGLAIVSVSPKDIPTFWFGIIPVPHIGFLEGIANAAETETTLIELHKKLAFGILGLFVLHVGAALKHHFVDKDDVLRSMSAFRIGALAGIIALFVALGFGVMTYFGSKQQPVVVAETTNPDEEVASDKEEPAIIEPVANGDDEVAEEPLENDPPAPPNEEPVTETPPGDALVVPPTDEPFEVKDPALRIVPATFGPCQTGARANWQVDNAQSTLSFTGSQGGNAFTGTFANFSAEIAFYETALEKSWIFVRVTTGSASTGDELRDSTIPGGEWFDVKDHPAAVFTSCEITRAGDGRYEAAGTLTIKDVSREITLPFSLNIDGDTARADGGVELIRTNFDLGAADSWLNAEGVALEVRVDTGIVATRIN